MSSIFCSIRKDRFNLTITDTIDLINSNSKYGKNGYFILHKNRLADSVSTESKDITDDSLLKATEKVKIYDTVIGCFLSNTIYNSSTYKNYFYNGLYLTLFDGFIENDSDIIDKYKFKNITSYADLYTKLFMLHLEATKNYQKALLRTNNELTGLFSIITFSAEYNNILIVKNGRPLKYAYSKMEYFQIGSIETTDLSYQIMQDKYYMIVNLNTLKIESEGSLSFKLPTYFKPIVEDSYLILSSGGIISSTLIAVASKILKLKNINILNVGYKNGTYFISEKQSTREVARKFGLDSVTLDIRNVYESVVQTPIQNPTIEHDLKFLNYYTPSKELFIIGTAINHARTIGCNKIMIGNTLDEYNPSNYQELIYSLNKINDTVGTIEIISPFKHMTKIDVLKLGYALDTPYELTIDCSQPVHIEDLTIPREQFLYIKKTLAKSFVGCGSCLDCTTRRYLFLANRLKDPQENLYVNPLVKTINYMEYMNNIKQYGYLSMSDKDKTDIVNGFKIL